MKRKKAYSKDEVRKLTTEWYKKLAQDGFQDLEFYDPRTGYGQNTYLKKPLHYIRKRFNKEAAQHYRLCSNFVEHGEIYPLQHRFILKLYADGYSYRQIIKIFNKKYKDRKKFKPMNLKKLSYLIRDLIKTCYTWNKVHPDGIRDEDIIIDDVLIKEPTPKLDPIDFDDYTDN